MTSADRDRLRALCVAASKGPWYSAKIIRVSHDDAAYIAACDPTTILALLDQLASAENVIEAAAALDQRLQEIHASSAFQGIWPYLEAHNVGYRGPNYKGQHQALQDALAAHKGKQK